MIDETKQTETETEITPSEPTPETPEAVAATVKDVPHTDLRSGMTVRLHERIRDVSPKGEERERVQIFEGIILNIRGAGVSRTMTLRKISNGVGVEKIFPLASPSIAKIEVVKMAKTRRGNLSFMRGFRRKLKETWVK